MLSGYKQTQVLALGAAPDRRLTRPKPGFLYYEVLEILQGLTAKGKVVGMDLVEVAPDYDQTGSTAFIAAQLLMSFLGYIFHAEGKSA